MCFCCSLLIGGGGTARLTGWQRQCLSSDVACCRRRHYCHHQRHHHICCAQTQGGGGGGGGFPEQLLWVASCGRSLAGTCLWLSYGRHSQPGWSQGSRTSLGSWSWFSQRRGSAGAAAVACSTGFSACGEEIGRGGEEEEEEEEGALPASALAAAAAAAGGGSWRDRCVDELARGLDGVRFAAMLGLQALLRHTRMCPCASPPCSGYRRCCGTRASAACALSSASPFCASPPRPLILLVISAPTFTPRGPPGTAGRLILCARCSARAAVPVLSYPSCMASPGEHMGG